MVWQETEVLAVAQHGTDLARPAGIALVRLLNLAQDLRMRCDSSSVFVIEIGAC